MFKLFFLRRLFIRYLIICFSFFAGLLAASVSDNNYFLLKDKKSSIIFSREHKSSAYDILEIQEKIHSVYRDSFSWELDDQYNLVLASSKNQIANAFATVVNTDLNFLYLTPYELESFASGSWINLLLLHEMAHLYQLDPKRDLSKTYHDYLGTYPIHVLLFLPVFGLPNTAIPSFMTEGNAVLNESRFGIGGRLYSGEERALFLSLLKDQVIGPSFLINAHDFFPYGPEKYAVGAYFMLYLAEKYSIDFVNKFFYHFSQHYINPYAFDKIFSNYFGASYYFLLDEFLRSWDNKAKEQRSAKGEILASSVRLSPLNADKDEIFFLETRPHSSLKLVSLEKRSVKIRKEETEHLNGKLFKIGNRYFVRRSGLIDKRDTLFSLWEDEANDLKEYRGKYLLDKKDDNELYFRSNEDAQDSIVNVDKPVLYFKENKKEHLIGPIDSKALFNDLDVKEFFYFKQKGAVRSLYKSNEKVLDLKTFYAKLVQVSGSDVYFISSSFLGSSLFKYNLKNKKIFEVVSSDAVIDARLIDKANVLIVELSSQGYLYKKVKLNPVLKRPMAYSYFFEKDLKEDKNLQQLFSKLDTKFDSDFGGSDVLKGDLVEQSLLIKEAASPKNLESEINAYSNIKNLSYIGTGALLSLNAISLTSLFSDPLMKNSLSLAQAFYVTPYGDWDNTSSEADNGWDKTYLMGLSYQNRANLVNYELSLTYKNETKDGRRIEKTVEEYNATVEFDWPIYKKGNWSFSLLEALSYDVQEGDRQGISLSGLFLNMKKENFLSFYPDRALAFALEGAKGTLRDYSINAFVQGSRSFFKNFNIFFLSSYKQSNTRKFYLGNSLAKGSYDIFSKFNDYEFTDHSKTLKRGVLASLGIAQTLNLSYYSERVPLSLKNLSLKAYLNAYNFYKTHSSWDTLLEKTLGLDMDLLLLHNLPLRVSMGVSFDDENLAAFLVRFNINQTF